jgi:hypothetical protein
MGAPAAYSTIVVIRDLADPCLVFGSARAAARNAAGWAGYDFGAVRMLVTERRQGVARVSVHFPAAAGGFLEGGRHCGSMAVMFLTEDPFPDPRGVHEEIIARLAVLLATAGLHWEWQHMDSEWMVGA